MRNTPGDIESVADGEGQRSPKTIGPVADDEGGWGGWAGTWPASVCGGGVIIHVCELFMQRESPPRTDGSRGELIHNYHCPVESDGRRMVEPISERMRTCCDARQMANFLVFPSISNNAMVPVITQ